MPLVVKLYFAAVGVMSVVTFTLYTWDKRRARKGGRRIPEATLHLCELLGGWPAGLLARHLLRHKSRKLAFRVLSWAIIMLHIGALALYACYNID